MKLLTALQVTELPTPNWLIDGLIMEESFVLLYGPPESGKSFLALDIALRVALGMDFHGRNVIKGSAIYVSAEGHLGARIQAWSKYHGQDLNEIDTRFHLGPVNLMVNTEVANLAEKIKELEINPKIMIFDTLARCMDGGDENSVQHMSQIIKMLDTFRQQSRCTIILVHHSGREGTHERGSSALPGAADTMIRIQKKPNNQLELKCMKQKEAEHFKPLHLKLKPVELEDNSSCVITACDFKLESEPLAEPRRKILQILADASVEASPLVKEIIQKSRIASSTFYREWQWLDDQGLREGTKITKKGREALKPDQLPLPGNSHGTPMEQSNTPITTTTPKSGSTGVDLERLLTEDITEAMGK